MSTSVSKYSHFSQGLLQPPPHLIHTSMLCDTFHPEPVGKAYNMVSLLSSPRVAPWQAEYSPHSSQWPARLYALPIQFPFFRRLLGFSLDLPFKCSFHCRHPGLCCSWNRHTTQATGPALALSVSLSPEALMTLLSLHSDFFPNQNSPPLRGLPDNPKQQWPLSPLAVMTPRRHMFPLHLFPPFFPRIVRLTWRKWKKPGVSDKGFMSDSPWRMGNAGGNPWHDIGLCLAQ